MHGNWEELVLPGSDETTRLISMWQRWDALWYTRVADLGYGYEVRLPNGDVHSNLAFFPLLPWLERLLSAPTPLSYADAGFVISLLASLAAAWGVFLHGEAGARLSKSVGTLGFLAREIAGEIPAVMDGF